VTGGAGLGVNLAQIGRADRDLMVNRTAGAAMVMTGKVGGMAGNTLTLLTAAQPVTGGAFEGAGGRIVAGGAAECGMDLASTDEG